MPEPDAVSVGARVTHPDFGVGRVLGLRRGGRVFQIEFDEMPGTPWDIPREDLTVFAELKAVPTPVFLPPAPPPVQAPLPSEPPKSPVSVLDTTAPPSEAPPAEPYRPDSVSARQAIEALRLGVVPSHHLDTYTIGRDAELAAVSASLAGDGGLTVVLGDYGTGKTHFLELVERMALARGFLAARVTLDSVEVQPSRPRRLYHRIATGIRYPEDPEGAPSGLCSLLDKAVRDEALLGRWIPRRGACFHPYLSPTLAYLAVLDPGDDATDGLRDRLLDWIHGAEVAGNERLDFALRHTVRTRGARLFALQDHRTVTHLYTLLLGGIAELARQVGYAGLVVTVDEAEFYSVLSGRDRAFAEILFKTVAAACLPAAELRFDPDALPRGGAPVHRSFPARFSASGPLHCLFALTHDPEGEGLLRRNISGNHFLTLSPFGTRDYVALSEKVIDLYRLGCRDLSLGEGLPRIMAVVIEACHRAGLIENPRQALKFITEIVDIARLAPERLQPVLADLKERLQVR